MAESEWQRFFPPTLEVKKTEEFGRGVYARQKIPRGTEILRSEPFVCVLDTDERESYCNFCLKAKTERWLIGTSKTELAQGIQLSRKCMDFVALISSSLCISANIQARLKPFEAVLPRDLDLKKCSQCKFVWYCGKECQRNDWHLHKSECKVLAKADTVHLQSQIVVRVHMDRILLTRLLLRMQKRNKEKPLPETAKLELDLLYPNRSNMSECIEHEDTTLVTQALGQLQKQMETPTKTEELVELFYKLKVNIHGICSDFCEHIGFGIYTGPSLLNHSCDPNCYRVYDGQTFILRAVKAIQPGEQLFISYISMLTTYKQRQAKLWETYHFRCQCHRCVSECQKSSPYHIMYAAIGDISDKEKEAIMEEGFSAIEKVDRMSHHQTVIVCQQLAEKYKDVLHPANILTLKIFNKLRRAFSLLQEEDSKILEAMKMVVGAYEYYPFKHEDYDYGMQLLDLGTLQMLMERYNRSRKTFTEAIDVLSVVVGPHHPLTILARKSRDIVTRKLR